MRQSLVIGRLGSPAGCWQYGWNNSEGVREGRGRHHSADFVLRGRCNLGETLHFIPPPPSTLADNWRHKLISIPLFYPPLAEGLVPSLNSGTCQYGLQWLVGLGCSEYAGFWRLSLLHYPGCWYWSWLSGKSWPSAAAIILSFSIWDICSGKF